MKKIFLGLLFLTLFFNHTDVFADTNNISNLIFVSAEQSLDPNTISSEIKVQTQNTSGNAESVSETNDVIFISSSASGEFLNSSGGVVTKTMSKNTSSRTFYYRDSASGTHTLDISIKGRDTGKTFSASQQITILGAGINPPVATTTATTTPSGSAATSTTSSTNNTMSGVISAHSNTVVVTYLEPILDLKADAGRERIVVVGTPIELEAKTSEASNYFGDAKYVWSFGDGTSESGKKVSHVYKFTGEYNVVLNVSMRDKHAVSRTRVRAVDQNVVIQNVFRDKNGFVELKNNSPFEVNVGNWKLKSDKGSMVFPVDTIIESGKSVKFPFEFLPGDIGEIILVYSDEMVATTFDKKSQENVFYVEPTREDIERAKAIVARQFINSTPSSETLSDSLDVDPKDDSVIPVEIGPSSSLIDTFKNKPIEEDSLLSTPKRVITFLKNFLTK